MAIDEILQIIQTIAIVGGMIGFLFEYRNYYRSRGYEAYVKSAEEYMDLEKLFLEYPDLQPIYSHSEFYAKLGDKDKPIYHWYAMFFMIFEKVYRAHHQKWMSKDEWQGWDDWIDDLAKHGKLFKECWEENRGMYHTNYVHYVDALVKIKN